MSTDIETKETDADHEHEQPSDWQYVKIALLLCVLTVIEVAISYIDEGAIANTALISLAILKFSIVALYFMHLKYDSPILKKIFISGIAFALVCYAAYLLTLMA